MDVAQLILCVLIDVGFNFVVIRLTHKPATSSCEQNQQTEWQMSNQLLYMNKQAGMQSLHAVTY